MSAPGNAKNNNTNTAGRDGDMKSPWQAGLPQAQETSAKRENITYDVLIIGGGITGMTAALMLQQQGKKCVLADAHSVGFGTTGGTSAHINTFADTTYKEAADAFGEEGAKLFADAVNEGAEIIRGHVAKYGIDCDLAEKKGYVYAEDDQQAKELEELYEGTTNAGVPISYTTDVPTPIAYKKAVVLEGQAQFHPMKYIAALQKAYIEAGGLVLEHLMIEKVAAENDILVASAGAIAIKAQHVIYATHVPPGLNVFNFKCAPYRSYVLAATLADGQYPDALVYDMEEPYHYFRSHTIEGQQYLLAGGNDHKTGHDDPAKAMADLEQYVREHYKVADIAYRWSSQYYVPVDGLPYIGAMPLAARNVYCATGYNGNGMMLGSIAGRILCDMVMEKENKYQELFSPARIKPVAGFKEFVTENADAAYEFIASRFTGHEIDTLNKVAKGTGEIVELDGRKIAAYRDEEGKIHTLTPVCTHAKCIVNWNSTEKSWDCPCHGARYDINGTVITGPANRNLEQIVV